MSEEPQPRDPHGHFKSTKGSCNCGGKTDISLKDVAEVIRALDDFKSPASAMKCDISVPEPVKVQVDLDDSIGVDIWHHTDESPVEDVFVKVAAGILLTVVTLAVLMWMLIKVRGY